MARTSSLNCFTWVQPSGRRYPSLYDFNDLRDIFHIADRQAEGWNQWPSKNMLFNASSRCSARLRKQAALPEYADASVLADPCDVLGIEIYRSLCERRVTSRRSYTRAFTEPDDLLLKFRYVSNYLITDGPRQIYSKRRRVCTTATKHSTF